MTFYLRMSYMLMEQSAYLTHEKQSSRVAWDDIQQHLTVFLSLLFHNCCRKTFVVSHPMFPATNAQLFNNDTLLWKGIHYTTLCTCNIRQSKYLYMLYLWPSLFGQIVLVHETLPHQLRDCSSAHYCHMNVFIIYMRLYFMWLKNV